MYNYVYYRFTNYIYTYTDICTVGGFWGFSIINYMYCTFTNVYIYLNRYLYRYPYYLWVASGACAAAGLRLRCLPRCAQRTPAVGGRVQPNLA